MADFELRPVDGSAPALRELSQLLREVWPRATHLTPAYLDWQYNRNPMGAVIGTNAFDATGRLVAHYVLHPLRTWLLGDARPGLIALNLCTHPAVRRTGVLRMAADETHARALEAGYDFFCGVTNASSAPVYRHWGHQLVSPLSVKLGIGPSPPRSDEGDHHFVRIWDRETLAWRLSDPERTYRAERRDGRAVVWTPTGRFGVTLEMGTFPAEWVPETVPEQRRPLAPRMWIGLDASRRWRGRLYADLPARLRPAPLLLTFIEIRREGRSLDAARVRFDAIDFDAF